VENRSKTKKKLGRPRSAAPRPVIALRVHESVYVELKASAERQKISISEDAAKRIGKTLAMDKQQIEQDRLMKAGADQFLIASGFQKVRDSDGSEMWVKGQGAVTKWTALGPEIEAVIERVVTRVLEKKAGT
jgi:hypothetical protein